MGLALEVWSKHAAALADWTLRTLAVRTDTFGIYTSKGPQRAKNWPEGLPLPLTRDDLIRHYQGRTTLGLYTTEPDEDTSNSCIIDIDAHGTRNEWNIRFGMALVEVAGSLGVASLLESSDGGDGYKWRCLFSQRIPAGVARRFGHWLVARVKEGREDFKTHVTALEVYPKQDTVSHTKQRCGNFVRLPGRHHKRPHVSAFWDGSKWHWAKEEAPLCWLHCPLNDPATIPDEARELRLAKKAVPSGFSLPTAYQLTFRTPRRGLAVTR